MPLADTLIRDALVVDGTGSPPVRGDVAITDGRITAVGALRAGGWTAETEIDARGRVLAPGFVDVHTHDDTNVVRDPGLWPKLSQGVTTVVVGNCGISAAPARLRGDPPDPMNLLGRAPDFAYPTFGAYRDAIGRARPAVNVAALVGHTTLRANHMDRLDRAATDAEIDAMRAELREALALGALGLSTGLAYANARAATTEEVIALTEPLAAADALYATHLRSEFAEVVDAIDEALSIGRAANVPVAISHLKCAGRANWGRAGEVLAAVERAQSVHPVGCDVYPYAAGSSTLDPGQVEDGVEITITWSDPHPEVAGRSLASIAESWGTTPLEAAHALMPAGAIYHSMSEQDVERILAHDCTVIGSDGLPNDPNPHPRLWGAFPRVLGRYARDARRLTLPQAVHKMTGLATRRFGLSERGEVRAGWWADLVLFDADVIADRATWLAPRATAAGIHAVWVNGVLASRDQQATGDRAGRFLERGPIDRSAYQLTSRA